MEEYLQWVKTYFFADSIPENVDNLNYFDAGLVNSLGIIDLIEKIESTFLISLNESHFQQRRFATISGLAEIIAELRTSGYLSSKVSEEV